MHNATDNDSQVKIFTAHRQLQHQTNIGPLGWSSAAVLLVLTNWGGLGATTVLRPIFTKGVLRQDCPDY